jgi:prepilin-type N-terminal cleavage/methylation domain-containing protein/prepilin-type processing-associated H-X9-DG protein
MDRVRARRGGFTLVELLVVIAIIGILVGLLLPAVQAAREAARRMSCQNNLKQMGLALHNYESTFKSLPPALFGSPFNGHTLDDDGFGWQVSILPFMEQQNTYDLIAPNGQPGALGDAAVRAATYPGVPSPHPGGNVLISAYRCPSSALPDFVPATFLISGDNVNRVIDPDQALAVGYATNDYKAAGGSCYGDFGAMHALKENPQGVRFRDITDGLSNTIAIAESSYVTDTGSSQFRDWPTWIGAFGDGGDETIRINGRTNSPINCQCNANKMILAINDDCAFSYHPGGAQFAFADGSVHFISENLDIQTYCDLHDRRDGNVLGQWQ